MCKQIPMKDSHFFDGRRFTRITLVSLPPGESFSRARSLPFPSQKLSPEFPRCIPADPQTGRERRTSSTWKLLLQDLGPTFPDVGCGHACLSNSSAGHLL